ncbi:MAG: hypothetical protein P8179_09465 [Candidatus Thiodiazotropha sp.]|jgi:hypothetical protein
MQDLKEFASTTPQTSKGKKMVKKYILFHSPLALVVLLAGLSIMILGLVFFAHLLRGYDFAVALIMGIISVITVNLCFNIEQTYMQEKSVRSDNE